MATSRTGAGLDSYGVGVTAAGDDHFHGSGQDRFHGDILPGDRDYWCQLVRAGHQAGQVHLNRDVTGRKGIQFGQRTGKDDVHCLG